MRENSYFIIIEKLKNMSQKTRKGETYEKTTQDRCQIHERSMGAFAANGIL